jgi:quinol monooxygenase YgiN
MTHRQEDRMSTGMIRSTIRMLIPLNKQSEALEILEMVKVRTQFEPGCISTRLYLGVDEARAIMIEELWTSEEDILHHLQSEAYHRVLLVVEMAEERPEIRFDTIRHSSGVETIEKARSRPSNQRDRPNT